MKRSDRISLLIIGVILILSGAGSVFGGLGVRKDDKARAGWKQVAGKIVAGRIAHEMRSSGNTGQKTFDDIPKLKYRYEAGGRTLEGEATAPSASQPYNKEQATATLAEYQPDASIPVYYDPANPTRSDLMSGRGTPGSS